MKRLRMPCIHGDYFKAVRVAPAILAIGLGTAGCARVDFSSFQGIGLSDLRLPSMSAPVPVEPKKAVTAEDLVDAEGRCASSPMAAIEPGAQVPGADPVTTPTNPALEVGGVALGMTECDVVKRSGPPEQIAIGANERAERTVTLTYTKNVRPGIYNFVSGRLVSIERAPEPPPPARPVRPARPAKPKPKPAPT